MIIIKNTEGKSFALFKGISPEFATEMEKTIATSVRIVSLHTKIETQGLPKRKQH
jgi:hypothetical protein